MRVMRILPSNGQPWSAVSKWSAPTNAINISDNLQIFFNFLTLPFTLEKRMSLGDVGALWYIW